MATQNSKDTTKKPDSELAARDKQIADLKSDVGILKQHIIGRQNRRIPNKVQGLSGLQGLQNTLGNQSIK